MSSVEVFEPFGRLFYIVSPNRTSFPTYDTVPNYVAAAYPDLIFLFFLEICISRALGKSYLRFNDSIACLSQGLLFELLILTIPGGQLAIYHYIYHNWRFVNLPWNALYTWCICFIGVDFAYYWLHRAAHGINFMWATHHVHHSSEDYNISTNVRQSILQIYTNWVFYLPLAFILPPGMYVVHAQFSYLYQFWIHTELIRSLGPLEFVLNTPSHHRVHHGANKMCIDRNFGGTLIIWDRLFGTFQAEKEGIVYGVTEPVKSFELFSIQFDHCLRMWSAIKQYKGWKNKLSVIFKGPGWEPGKPWLGDLEDIPVVKAPVPKYDPQLPGLIKIYLLWHFFLLVQGYTTMRYNYRVIPESVLYGTIIYMLFSLTCIGMLLDKRIQSARMELSRCLLFFVVDYYFVSYTGFSLTDIMARWVPEAAVRITWVTSLLFWILYCLMSEAARNEKVRCMITTGWKKTGGYHAIKHFYPYSEKMS